MQRNKKHIMQGVDGVQFRKLSQRLLILSAAAGAACIALIPNAAIAASGTWTGGAGTGDWLTAGNWTTSPAASPGATSGTTNADTATFNNNTQTTITVDSGRNIKNVFFDTSVGNFVIGSAGANGGNALTISNGGQVELKSTATGSNLIETFNTPLVLVGGVSFFNNGGTTRSMVFNGNVSGASGGATVLTISGSGSLNINGNISDGAATSLSIIKNGGQSLFLTGNNSFTGGISITGGGSVTFTGANSFGNGNFSTSNSGGTLKWGTGTSTDISAGHTVTLGAATTFDVNGNDVILASSIGNSGVGVLSARTAAGLAGKLTILGANTFSGGFTFINGVPLTVAIGTNTSLGSGTITTQLATTLMSSDTTARTLTNGLVLSAGQTFGGLGDLTFSSGTGNTSLGALTVNDAITVSVASTFSGSAAITKSGTGTLALSGTNTNTGDTLMSRGTLRGLQATGSPFGTGNIVVSGGTLSLAPTGSGSAVSLTIASGSGKTYTSNFGSTIELNRGSHTSLLVTSGATGAVVSTFLRGPGTTVIFAPSAISELGASSGNFIQFKATGTTTVYTAAAIAPGMVGEASIGTSSAATAADFLTYGATGFIKATYGITGSGSTTFSDNTKAAELTADADLTANSTALGVKTANTITGSGMTLNIGNGSQGGLILNGGTISVTTLAFGGGETSVYTSAANGTINSNLTGTGSYNKFGIGTLTLTGSSTIGAASGGITANVNGGTLKITNGDALFKQSANTGTNTINVNADAAFEMANIDYSAGGNRTPTINLNNSGATLRASGGTSIYSKGSGGLAVTSGKSVNLDTTLSTDVLQINTGFGGGGTGSLVNVTGPGTVNIASNASAAVTLSWDVNGGGKLLVNSTGTSPIGSAGASVKITNGTFALGSDTTTNYAYTLAGGTFSGAGTGTRTVSPPSTMFLANSTTSTINLKDAGLVGTANMNLTFAGNISGNGNLIVAATGTGTGTLLLGGTNAYTGTTTVSSGTLLVNGVHTGGGAYTVANTARLGGTGTINSSVGVASGGTITGGVTGTISTLTLGSTAGAGLTLATGSKYSADVDLTNQATIPGGVTAYLSDRLSVLGTVTLAGTLELNLVNSPTDALSPARTIVLIQNDGTDAVTGTFDNIFPGSSVGGPFTYAVDYAFNADSGTVGNDVAVTFSSVPEPASSGLLLLGSVALMKRRQRRVRGK